MKLLMLGWELPPHNSGGLGVACYQLCRHLARAGVEIDFVVPYEAEHTEIDFMNVIAATPYSAEDLQIATRGVYDSSGFGDETLVSDARSLVNQQKRYTRFVEQLVKRNDYHLIHAHEWLTYDAATAAKEISRRPLVVHVHATEFDRAGGEPGNQLVHDIEYHGIVMADRVVAVSQATKEIIVDRYDIPEDKIEVVHNSVNAEDYGKDFTVDTYRYITHMKQKGYKVVVSIGRLTIQKGLRYLLEATALAVSRNPKLLLVIAGSGEQYHELIELSAELGIAENVIFTGFVRGQAWRDLYAVGDMFVMPSVSEPFGLTALEAAGYGNAVLLSKQSGVGEVLRNVLRFDFWDTHLLASQLLALAEYPVFSAELIANLTHEFKYLSWEKAAETCIRMYAQVGQSALSNRPSEVLV